MKGFEASRKHTQAGIPQGTAQGSRPQGVRTGQPRATDKSPGRWGRQSRSAYGMCWWDVLPGSTLPTRGQGDSPNSDPETSAAVPKEWQLLLKKISQDFVYQDVPWSMAFHVE